MPTNGKNGKKWPKIANNCKISEITKYFEKITTIDKNVKKCKKKCQKRTKMVKLLFFHRFSGSKLPQKMILAVFTRCLVPEMHIFGHFLLKSALFGPNFGRTELFTAKPMVVGCV